MHRYEFAAHLTGCFLFVTLASIFVGLAPQASSVRIANGVLLAYLLLAPRWRWPAYAVAGFIAQMVGCALFRESWQSSLLFNLLNLTEVLLAAFLLRRRSGELPRFTERTYLLKFFCYAVLVAPLTVGLLYAGISVLLSHAALFPSFTSWVAVDGAGLGVVTPICVSIFRTRFTRLLCCGKKWVYLLPLFFIAVGALAEAKAPLRFLIYPLLIWILFRMGMGWASVSMFFILWVGGWYTVHGEGPFAHLAIHEPVTPSFLLQAFVATGVLMLYSVFAVLERHRLAVIKLEKIVALHALVTENSRDVIILADKYGHRSFVSPASESMVGWKPEELVTQEYTDIIHPDDVDKAKGALRDLLSGAGGAIVEVRVRKKNGEYLWVEASLRQVLDPKTHLPAGILNMVRDISERKRSEQKLHEAYNAVETLAVTDALTGLANRRRFDQYLAIEWRRAMRNRQSLSLLMLDADFFKAYNDTYGHMRGDSCLKQIAEAALDVVVRSEDLVARFGGEEFVVILPNTGSEGATQVANEICEALRRRKLQHGGNPCGIVTVSVGCATVIPSRGQHSVSLIELADLALYRAKQNGRNQVCNGNGMTGAACRFSLAPLPTEGGHTS